MAEHLNTHRLTHRTFNAFLLDCIIDLAHLFQVQFTRQYYHIGKLRIKLQGFSIADIQLSRQMYLLSHLVTVSHHSHIGSNHGTHAPADFGFKCVGNGFLGCIHNLAHQFDVLIIDDRIDGQVTLYPMFITHLCDLTQIINSKRAGRTGAHIQTLNAKIDGICSRMKSCRQ